MDVAIKNQIVALTIASLQLVPTDAAAEMRVDGESHTDGGCLTSYAEKATPVVAFECEDSGTRAPVMALVPSVTATELAHQRAPNLVAQASSLASLAHTLASKAGLRVRELVLRGDWSEEDDPEHTRGVVLDIFASGDTETRLEFWGAAAEALAGLDDAGGVELSVMVHACWVHARRRAGAGR